MATQNERIDIGLSDKLRTHFASELSGVLDDTYSLLVQTHLYHWNVRGPLFEPIHKLLEEQYEALFKAADEIAERVRQLGFPVPIGTSSFPSGVSVPSMMPSEEDMLADLLGRHESVIKRLRPLSTDADDNKDYVTQDMVNELLAFHEKAAWMLRSIITTWSRGKSEPSPTTTAKK